MSKALENTRRRVVVKKTSVDKSENPAVSQDGADASADAAASPEKPKRGRPKGSTTRKPRAPKSDAPKRTRTTRSKQSPPGDTQANTPNKNESEDDFHEEGEVLWVNELGDMNVPKLRVVAQERGLEKERADQMNKSEIVSTLAKMHYQAGGVLMTKGVLDVHQDGYGFLRAASNNYLPGDCDTYIPNPQIRLFHLRTGDLVSGILRSPKDKGNFSLYRVSEVNDRDPRDAQTRVAFEDLTPLYPQERIDMEYKQDVLATRMINLFCPIGKGQRGLIVSPPRTGKTVLMQQIANAITTNHPEIHLMVLLVDERPEEVTDMQRNVKGEVIASTFDEQATRHVQVAEMVIERAKRLVENGRDVVVLLDSITRLARAYNQTVSNSGKVLSGGVDSNALHKPKRFFGAARNIEHGGSLTIVATALVETGSKMDEVIFEEFKGTGNMEIILDRKMADKRVYPAVAIKRSGTRKDDLLLKPHELNRILVLRKAFSDMEEDKLTELIIDKFNKTKDNDMFLLSMDQG